MSTFQAAMEKITESARAEVAHLQAKLQDLQFKLSQQEISKAEQASVWSVEFDDSYPEDWKRTSAFVTVAGTPSQIEAVWAKVSKGRSVISIIRL